MPVKRLYARKERPASSTLAYPLPYAEFGLCCAALSVYVVLPLDRCSHLFPPLSGLVSLNDMSSGTCTPGLVFPNTLSRGTWLRHYSPAPLFPPLLRCQHAPSSCHRTLAGATRKPVLFSILVPYHVQPASYSASQSLVSGF